MRFNFFSFLISCLLFQSAQAIEVGENRLKVDENGLYVSFQGVTIIAPIAEKRETFFAELHEKLAKTLIDFQPYYALLPVSSYHMTTNNLYSKNNKKSWKHAMSQRGLNQLCTLRNDLLEKAFTPIVTIHGITVKTTIKLVVKLEQVQESVIRDIAVKHQIEDKIPSVFHITLGYLFRDIPHKDLLSLEAKIKRIVKGLTKTYGNQVTLGLPALCSFPDMTSFIPWDGSQNPF